MYDTHEVKVRVTLPETVAEKTHETNLMNEKIGKGKG